MNKKLKKAFLEEIDNCYLGDILDYVQVEDIINCFDKAMNKLV